MKRSRTSLIATALAVAIVAPACASPVLKNIMDWPGPGKLLGLVTGLTRSGHDFFAGVFVRDADSVGHTSIIRMTQPPHPHGKWTTSVIYSFPGDTASGPPAFETSDSLLADEAGRVYGYGYRDCPAGGGSCGIIYMLQPPVSGSGLWTRTDIWVLRQDAHTTGIESLTLGRDGNLYGFGVGPSYESSCYSNPMFCGVIFQLSPDSTRTTWNFNVIHEVRFPNIAPSEVAIDKAGNLVYHARTLESPATIYELSLEGPIRARGGVCSDGANGRQEWIGMRDANATIECAGAATTGVRVPIRLRARTGRAVRRHVAGEMTRRA